MLKKKTKQKNPPKPQKNKKIANVSLVIIPSIVFIAKKKNRIALLSY